MSKRIAIIQSNYIPWKGYFDIINSVDQFILYDDAQYTRRDWRNRNLIKTANGLLWLTIPVEVKGRYHQKIKDTRIADAAWGRKHWTSIENAYAQAAHFGSYAERFRRLYLASAHERLSEVNHAFISAICDMLGIETRLSWSMDFAPAGEGPSELILSLCAETGATEYLSGPSARAYLSPAQFAERGVSVRFMDYDDYPAYEQVHPPFEHRVSILDLLFNTGPEAPRYMKSLARSGPTDGR